MTQRNCNDTFSGVEKFKTEPLSEKTFENKNDLKRNFMILISI